MSVLDYHVLKLNKNWLPISSENLPKTMKRLISGKAKVLDTETWQMYAFIDWMKKSIKEGDRYIRTTSGLIKIPEIIIMNNYSGDPGRNKKVIYNRRNIYRRDNGYCQYCAKKVKSDDWEIDHVLPKSRGGKSSFDNVVLCCTKCNRKKANRTPSEAGMLLVRFVKIDGQIVKENYDKPKIPKWNALFAVRPKKIRKSWKVFLKDLISELYWDVELED
jgi:hypothetical protein